MPQYYVPVTDNFGNRQNLGVDGGGGVISTLGDTQGLSAFQGTVGNLPQGYSQIFPRVNAARTTGGGGGGATAPAPAPAPGPTPTAPTGPSPEEAAAQQRADAQSQQERELGIRRGNVDNIFSDIMAGFDERQQAARGGFDQSQDALRGGFDSERNIINTATEQANRLVGSERGRVQEQNQMQQGQNARRQEDALNSSRRLANELEMRNRQMFGGRNSVAEFGQELLGRETARNLSQTRQTGAENQQQLQMQFNQQMSGIAEKEQQIQENTASQLQQVEAQQRQAMAQLRNNFDQRVDAIKSDRQQAEGQKANLMLEELRDLRTRSRALMDQANTFKQNLQLQAKEALDGLRQSVAAFQIEQGRGIDFSRVNQAQQQGFASANLPAAGLGFQQDLNTPTLTGFRGREDEERR